MQSRCSNCGGLLARGTALGACYRCGHALTGANWELLPPSRRAPRQLHTAWLIGGGALIGIGIAAASFALFGDEEEAPQRVRVPNVTVSVGALAPAATAPAQTSPSAPPPSSLSTSSVPAPAPPASGASH